MPSEEKARQKEFFIDEQRKKNLHPTESGSPFIPTWLLRLFVLVLPLAFLGFLGDMIPMWQSAAPAFFSTSIGSLFFTGTAVVASIIGAALYYFIYFRFLKTTERLWTAVIILVIIGLLLGL